MRHARGVAQRDLVRAEPLERGRDVGHPLRGNLPLEGASVRRRDVGAHAHAAAGGRRVDRRDRLQRGRDAHVQVLEVMALAGAHDGHHMRESGRHGPLEPLHVGDERVEEYPRPPFDAGEELLRIGHLGDPLRMNEAGGLDQPAPGLDEQVGQGDLLLGRDEVRLVLQSVARPDLQDAYALRQRAHAPRSAPAASKSTSSTPSLT